MSNCEQISFFVCFTGYDYDLHFTATPPQKIRLHLVNADPTDCVLYRIFYGHNRKMNVWTITDEPVHLAQVGKPTPDWTQGCTYIRPKNLPVGSRIFTDPAQDPTVKPRYVY